MFKVDVLCEKNRDMVPGAVVSEIDDRCRLLSRIVGVLVRLKASLGTEKIGPMRRIQTPRKKKTRPKHTKPNSRTSRRAELRPMFDRLTAACMHACTTRSCTACFVSSIALSWAQVTTLSHCSSN